MSICERPDSSGRDSSCDSQHVSARFNESFFSDTDDSGFENSDVTDSSDETKVEFVPSLNQLSRAITPELALGLEATRRAIVEILFRLEVTAGMSSTGETSPYTIRPGYPQSASTDSSFQQESSKQTTNDGKVPFGNGSNGKNGKGPDGNANYGENNGDGGEDDWGIQGTITTNLGHCACCPYSRSRHSAGSKQPTPLVVAGAASLKFACPYFKHNPNNHLEGSCKGPGWSDVSRVK